MANNVFELVGAGLTRDLIDGGEMFFVVHRSRKGRDVGDRAVIQTYPFRSQPGWRRRVLSLHDAMATFIVHSYIRTTETVQQVYLEFVDGNSPADIKMAGEWEPWCLL
jgi:hypothetical protein